MNINTLRQKWKDNAESHKTAEVGSGPHDFVNDILSHPALFALKELTTKSTKSTRKAKYNDCRAAYSVLNSLTNRRSPSMME